MKQVTSHQRITLLTRICIIIMVVFVGRLFYMQIIRHDHYTALASEEQVKTRAIPATRGEIYAFDGDKPIKLVYNEPVFTVFADPETVKEPKTIVKELKSIAGAETVSNVDELVRDKPMRYHVVAKNITMKQAKLLKAKKLAGLGFQQTSRRFYPEGQLASQTLGFVNADGQGQYGVEAQLQSELEGKDGVLKSVTDVANIPLTIGSKNTEIPARHGKNVVLTLDRNIQSYTEKALADGVSRSGASKGSAIVMDPRTGRVLAMANVPTYNPEKYGEVTDASAFNNNVIMSPYEPGSVMKTFTSAVGIDRGAIKANSTYNNTDTIKVFDRSISNLTKGQTGNITMQHALNFSLNTGMVTIVQRLGDGTNITREARNIMYDYLHNRYMLGQKTGIELSGEAAGEVISPENVEGNAVRYANMSFGQGMNLTMVQVAAGFSSIVNGGNYYKPTVISGYIDDEGSYQPASTPVPLQRTMSEAASAETKQMIHDARAAFHGRLDKPGYDIGGKTGTSQTLIQGSYDNDQTIASYLGYGGDSTPRYVIMVQVSAEGKSFGGSSDAMPIFTDISNWMIDYMKLQPRS